jgi:hypothetical protein
MGVSFTSGGEWISRSPFAKPIKRKRNPLTPRHVYIQSSRYQTMRAAERTYAFARLFQLRTAICEGKETLEMTSAW